MRNKTGSVGFTLIELMIVIAIIAIIAAIAIPNLLESRVSANESATANTLKSGVFPAQVQWQGGGYQDADGDNIGEYATLEYLVGVRLGTRGATDIRLLQGQLAINRVAGQSERNSNHYFYLANVHGVDVGGAAGPLIPEGQVLPGYAAGQVCTYGERYWLVGAAPMKMDDYGRRVFLIANDGQVRSPAGAQAAATTNVMAPRPGPTVVADVQAGMTAALATPTDLSTYIQSAALQSTWLTYVK